MPRKRFIPPEEGGWWPRQTATGQWVVADREHREVIRHGSEWDRCRVAYMQAQAPVLWDALKIARDTLERHAVQGRYVDPNLLWHLSTSLRGAHPPDELANQISRKSGQQEVSFGEVA